MLKLQDLLPVIDENTPCVKIEMNGEEVARYDGKNSIPTELNECTVLKEYISGQSIIIEIKDTDTNIT
jgi:hypothetical protein